MDNDEVDSVALCRICREKIKPGANKCIQCGSFQDWRRFLNFSNTILALLVALVSVLSWGIPVIKEAIKEDKSEIIFGLQTVSGEGITMLVSNIGTKAGGLSDAILNIKFDIEVNEKGKRLDPIPTSSQSMENIEPDPLPGSDKMGNDNSVKPILATGVHPLTQLLAEQFENNYEDRLKKGSSYLLRAGSLGNSPAGASPFLKPGEVGQYLYRLDGELDEFSFDLLRADINRYLVEKSAKRNEITEYKYPNQIEYLFDDAVQNLFKNSMCSIRFRAINYNGEESNYTIESSCYSMMPYLGDFLSIKNPYHVPFRKVR